MKNLFLVFSVLILILTSCEKSQDVENNLDSIGKSTALAAAKELSKEHDFFVKEFLFNMDHGKLQRVKGIDSSNRQSLELIFDAVELVAGVRPVVLEDQSTPQGIAKIRAQGDLPVYDFNRSDFGLSTFNESNKLNDPFQNVDKIVKDEGTSPKEKVYKLEELQYEILINPNASLQDYTNFINSTEVLKGSLEFWSDYADGLDDVGLGIEFSATNPMTKWPFLAKLAFVAAADAIGAVAGNFIGSYLIVNGVPIYVPAGPQGAAVGLAVLSVIAASMVGW